MHPNAFKRTRYRGQDDVHDDSKEFEGLRELLKSTACCCHTEDLFVMAVIEQNENKAKVLASFTNFSPIPRGLNLLDGEFDSSEPFLDQETIASFNAAVEASDFRAVRRHIRSGDHKLIDSSILASAYRAGNLEMFRLISSLHEYWVNADCLFKEAVRERNVEIAKELAHLVADEDEAAVHVMKRSRSRRKTFCACTLISAIQERDLSYIREICQSKDIYQMDTNVVKEAADIYAISALRMLLNARSWPRLEHVFWESCENGYLKIAEELVYHLTLESKNSYGCFELSRYKGEAVSSLELDLVRKAHPAAILGVAVRAALQTNEPAWITMILNQPAIWLSLDFDQILYHMNEAISKALVKDQREILEKAISITVEMLDYVHDDVPNFEHVNYVKSFMQTGQEHEDLVSSIVEALSYKLMV